MANKKKYETSVALAVNTSESLRNELDKEAEKLKISRADLVNKYIRKGLGLATILIMVTLASCNKEPQTFCYECETIETTEPKSIMVEWCNWTEEAADRYEADLTYTQPNGDNYVTTCKKK